jgi:hypothetical protein
MDRPCAPSRYFRNDPPYRAYMADYADTALYSPVQAAVPAVDYHTWRHYRLLFAVRLVPGRFLRF